MKHFGLVGKDVSYSYSKLIHEFLGSQLNIDLEYDLISTNDLATVDLTAYDGLNITIPYKAQIIKELRSSDQFVEQIDSCNTLTRELEGYNTDKDGFAYLCKRLVGDLDLLKRVVILGNSNSAKMIKAVLGSDKCVIISRQTNEVNNYFTYADELEIYGDLLINTTPIGQGIELDKSPLKENLIKKFNYVIDLNYNPNINPFLNFAAKNQIPNCNGLWMLVVQAIKAFEIWNELTIEQNLYEQTYTYIDQVVNPKEAIIGMPYAGKTYYGNEMKKQEKKVVDLDCEIERTTGVTNDNFIKQNGIEAFRQVETKVLASLVQKPYDVLILGGGIIENFDNRLLLKYHRIKYLELSFSDLVSNFEQANLKAEQERPLTNDLGKLEVVFKRRKFIYPFFQNQTIK